ncbi:MAG: CpsB/CapC family capsule biosynthesis tyrosine phosphatase [Sellimonas intestinalis]|uniref:CpsB/CapC family capsule biosynthesis tyrosine phosphatase n=1 Tax=Sellimonas intestinalis TaxID=1653434 RepID=UPI0039A26B30
MGRGDSRSWWQPHYHKQRGKNDIELIKKQLLLTRKLAKEVHPKMQICLGMEIYYGEECARAFKGKEG